MNRLQVKYNEEIKSTLMSEFKFDNVMQLPKLDKIVINMGLGKAVTNAKIIDDAVEEMTLITGQRPVVTKAKKSIATFKLREGMPIGVKVTLRGQKMYNFLDKLVSIALPRVRDFRGVSDKAFDGRGNYTFGIKEHLVFPEIEFDKVNMVKGMDITVVTTAKTDDEAKALLKAFGVPFKK